MPGRREHCLLQALAQLEQDKVTSVKSIISSFNMAMSHPNIIFILVITFHFYYAGKVFGSVVKWVVYMKYKEITVMTMIEVL